MTSTSFQLFREKPLAMCMIPLLSLTLFIQWQEICEALPGITRKSYHFSPSPPPLQISMIYMSCALNEPQAFMHTKFYPQRILYPTFAEFFLI